MRCVRRRCSVYFYPYLSLSCSWREGYSFSVERGRVRSESWSENDEAFISEDDPGELSMSWSQDQNSSQLDLSELVFQQAGLI